MIVVSSYAVCEAATDGDLGVIVRGRHLDDVGGDQVAGGQAAQDLQQLAGGHAARLGRAGAGRVRRVEAVDVDGDVQRAVADALAQLVGDLVGAAPRRRRPR